IDVDEWDPIQVQDLEIEFGELPPVDATLKVATDDENIYVLLEVPDAFDYNPAEHDFSAAMAVMFRIDDAAPASMGVELEDLEASLGVVDIWHWELDCGPGEMSGGGDTGDDPECNLDDEYAPNPGDREDDGGGDTPNNPTGENSLSGVWTHTAAEAGGEGTWIFEMSRPLQTGDTQDAQFASGEKVYMALAYWDPDETVEGWTGAGHLQSADNGWLEVALP
ncbi:MAG: ethylbenzene dehydrogenase-related protein, partial [Dehalococcoidia bacterium]|nr:ethylbenzene dehydrogenase-related protein [Dehalococcoidia bacterium]